MAERNYCKYVDVFYGNGEVDHFPESGTASKWFYIKALCGNTAPHAVLPFGKMSVGAYSGAYPTGYGNHRPNCSGGIRKLGEKPKAKGFSHIHQTGVGAIGYYYNYAVVSPIYGDVKNADKYYELLNEKACPGYYQAEINDVLCEMTVSRSTAFHRYSFKKSGGRIVIDFSNDGLLKEFGPRFFSYAKDAEITLKDKNKVFFSGVLSGVKLYFCAQAEGKNVAAKLFSENKENESRNKTIKDAEKNFGAMFDFSGEEICLKVSYSTVSAKIAEENISEIKASFCETKKEAERVWNEHLSAIAIETDDEEMKEKFYSNFYHSLIKPCDMTGERLMGIEGDLVTDFATFWDQYKTQLPLIFMLYPEMGEKIALSIKNISKALGKIPCSLGLTTIFACEEQAKMLGILSLCDAHHMGVPSATAEAIDECIKRELSREDFKSFTEDGLFERYTHILDTTDACLCTAEITKDEELKKRLLGISKSWKNAYNESDGLMSEKSVYYEGDRYTYSFRLQKNMAERIELAGGKEKFAKMLDDFFGIEKESQKQLTYVGAGEDIVKTRHHRFEGFNNECDMETPYAYAFSGCHFRLCDIIHACIEESFTLGRGALPGNNDSGGLSSCFIWNVLGLFPVSGSGEFIIGAPHFKKAVISLSNGKKLEIESNYSKACYYTDYVTFNGEAIEDYKISAQKLMSGGKLVFVQR